MKQIITAENQFAGPMKIKAGQGFSVSISGIFTATFKLQRVRQEFAPDGAADWKTVKSYTSVIEENGTDHGTHWYRLGVPTGSFTSVTGEVVAEITL